MSIRYLTVVGILHTDNSLDLQPSFQVDHVPLGPWARLEDVVPENLITVELVDAAGQVLARQQIPAIAPCVYPTGSVTGELILAAAFAMPGNTHTVRYIRSGNTVHQVQVPDSPPHISLSWSPPAPPAFAVGRQIVSWSADHPQGIPLRFLVLYSNDSGASWQPVSLVTDANQLELDFDQLPGGSAKLRVQVSDGINTAVAESPVFLVGPPIISASPSSLDFGHLRVGLVKTMTIQLRNLGTSPLNISGISDPGESVFSIVGTRPRQIVASGTATLRVQFAPLDVGLYSSAITIESNDPRQPSLEIVLKGTGTEAKEEKDKDALKEHTKEKDTLKERAPEKAKERDFSSLTLKANATTSADSQAELADRNESAGRRAFIRPEERPVVGEEALMEPDEPRLD